MRLRILIKKPSVNRPRTMNIYRKRRETKINVLGVINKKGFPKEAL